MVNVFEQASVYLQSSGRPWSAPQVTLMLSCRLWVHQPTTSPRKVQVLIYFPYCCLLDCGIDPLNGSLQSDSPYGTLQAKLLRRPVLLDLLRNQRPRSTAAPSLSS